MSEFQRHGASSRPIRKHEGADALSITDIGEFHEGDLAVYVPVDAVVPANEPRWAFLAGHTHVKAMRLRGVFSMGLLAKPEPGWVEGQEVSAELRITRFQPPEPTQGNEPDPGLVPTYGDIPAPSATALPKQARWAGWSA